MTPFPLLSLIFYLISPGWTNRYALKGMERWRTERKTSQAI